MNAYLDFDIPSVSVSPLTEIKNSIEEWMQTTRTDDPSDFFRIRDQINQQLEFQLWEQK